MQTGSVELKAHLISFPPQFHPVAKLGFEDRHADGLILGPDIDGDVQKASLVEVAR
jgi:hypothetical protein